MAGYVKLGSEETGMLNIYDMFGRLIKAYSLNPNNNILPIGSHIGEEGVYIYQIVVEDQTKATGKLTRIR